MTEERAPPSAPATPEHAWIVVRRSNERADPWRRYWIRVDGVNAGQVARGAQLMRRVTPGLHTIDATLDWAGSQAVTVDCPPGSTTVLRVAGKHQGWRILFLMVYAIFGHRDYLVLEVEDRDELPPQRPRTLVVRPPGKA